MKSIIEQYNACRHLETKESEAPSIPVLGRLCRSPMKQLSRMYREGVPAVMLVSHSRFATGYVLDRFLATLDEQTTLIRIEQSFDDPAAFMDRVMSCIGFDMESTSLAHLEQAFMLFLRYQKTRRQRTVLAIRDIDAHGARVLATIRALIEQERANEFGLTAIVTGPATDSVEPVDPMLDTISLQAAERIILTPFVLSETREFIRERFERGAVNGSGTGDATPRFEVYATQLIHELGSGVPETVDLLCRESVDVAAHSGSNVISTAEVKAAARLIGLLQEDDDETQDTASTPHDSPGQLIVKIQGQPERTIALNGSHVLIGRDKLCDICVDDSKVSRFHGLVARAAEAFYYLDLGSTNGSAVNGENAQRLALASNDVIAVGDVRIIYSLKAGNGADDVDLDATDTFEVPQFDDQTPINYVGNGFRRLAKS